MNDGPSVNDPTPEAIAKGLKPKHAKRLRMCAHELVPWSDAMKSHRQLREAGLVDLGTDGEREYALGSDLGKQVAAFLEPDGA